MRAQSKLFLSLAVCLLSASSTLFAIDLTEALRINGFGTVGITANQRDDIRFKFADQQSGVGKHRYDPTSNTIAGIQGRYQLTDSFSVDAQGLVRYKGSDGTGKESWAKSLEWAHINYEANNGASLRVGKFRFPLFQSSELAYVGYSRLYINPVLYFYGVGHYEYLNGAQAGYDTALKDYNLNLRASYGNSQGKSWTRRDGAYDSVNSDDIKIASAKIGDERFWINAFYTKFQTDMTTHTPGKPDLHRGKTGVTMAGVEWEFTYASATLNGGYVSGQSKEFQPNEIDFYSSLSYRIDSYTPYVLFTTKSLPKQPAPAFPLPLGVIKAPDNDFTDRSLSLGCRYDITQGVALKAQWDRLDVGARTPNVINTSVKHGIDNAFHITLDWMF